jgi:DNA sulfur modification protein DndD
MKLLALRLFNFRQFWGEVHLDLACIKGSATPRSSTATMALGKTTLLNAFTWVLYESV